MAGGVSRSLLEWCVTLAVPCDGCHRGGDTKSDGSAAFCNVCRFFGVEAIHSAQKPQS